MTIDRAVRSILSDRVRLAAARKGWGEPGFDTRLVVDVNGLVVGRTVSHGGGADTFPWHPHSADVVADDWCVIDQVTNKSISG